MRIHRAFDAAEAAAVPGDNTHGVYGAESECNFGFLYFLDSGSIEGYPAFRDNEDTCLFTPVCNMWEARNNIYVSSCVVDVIF